MAMLSSALEHSRRRVVSDSNVQPRSQTLIRVFDITIASAALLFFLPVMALIAAVLALQGGPVLFAHQRVGFGGSRFYCFKFRSMVANAEDRLSNLLRNDPRARQEWFQTQKLRRDPRVTNFGRFLRRSSLDELPQLLNVLRGQMSIVGPRPIVEAEIYRYGHRFSNYCSVKPGITGIWQISGRNDVSYRRRVAIDSLYAKSLRPGLYLWIVVATVPVVLARRGSY